MRDNAHPSVALGKYALQVAEDFYQSFIERIYCKENITVEIEEWSIKIRPNNSDFEFSFDDLERFSKKIGTKMIDIQYTAEDHGYSEYTPGSNSEIVFVIQYPKWWKK